MRGKGFLVLGLGLGSAFIFYLWKENWKKRNNNLIKSKKKVVTNNTATTNGVNNNTTPIPVDDLSSCDVESLDEITPEVISTAYHLQTKGCSSKFGKIEK